jgi:hypothetical protein
MTQQTLNRAKGKNNIQEYENEIFFKIVTFYLGKRSLRQKKLHQKTLHQKTLCHKTISKKGTPKRFSTQHQKFNVVLLIVVYRKMVPRRQNVENQFPKIGFVLLNFSTQCFFQKPSLDQLLQSINQ